MPAVFTKPFRVGEHVAVVGVNGDVTNRKIVGEIVHNFGGHRQLNLSVAVAQPGDLAALLVGVGQVVSANARVLKDPPPAIGIVQVSDGGVKISVQPWVRVPDVGVADGELYQALLEHLRARGVAGPAPRLHDVRLVEGARG